MERGFVKLWRKSTDSGMMQNHKLWVFWTWCLLKATHKKREQMVGMQMVTLEPGDFIFGRKAASRELKISEQTIRTCVQNLKKLENITIKATNKFSVISIVNWGSYQDIKTQANQQANQQLTNNQPTTNQQLTNATPRNNTVNCPILHDTEVYHNGKSPKINHKQEDKKTRRQEILSPNKSSDKPTPKEKTFSTELCKFVGDFIDYVIKEKGNKAPKKTKRLTNTSLDTVDKLIRLDGFSLEYIRSVARWAVVDNFYSTSFFSLASLRNKSKTNDVSKFVNMASRYDKEVGTVKNGPPPTTEEICKSYGL